jgi:hypothetical protein
MTLEKFQNQNMAGKPGALAWFMTSNVVEQWNNTFNMTYWEFRHQLTLIAERTLAATGVEVIKGQLALLRELADPEDCMLLPIDDDDWFSPKLVKLVSKTDAPVPVWPIVNCIHHRCWQRDALHGLLSTNAYGIRKSFLLALPLSRALQVTAWHSHAQRPWHRTATSSSTPAATHTKTIGQLSTMGSTVHEGGYPLAL